MRRMALLFGALLLTGLDSAANADTALVAKEAAKVFGRKSADLPRAIRRLLKETDEKVLRILEKNGPSSSNEIRDASGLTPSQLNHSLTDLKNVDLVALIDGKYYLTKYCCVLLGGLDNLRNMLADVSEEELFSLVDHVDNYEERTPKNKRVVYA